MNIGIYINDRYEAAADLADWIGGLEGYEEDLPPIDAIEMLLHRDGAWSLPGSGGAAPLVEIRPQQLLPFVIFEDGGKWHWRRHNVEHGPYDTSQQAYDAAKAATGDRDPGYLTPALHRQKFGRAMSAAATQRAIDWWTLFAALASVRGLCEVDFAPDFGLRCTVLYPLGNVKIRTIIGVGRGRDKVNIDRLAADVRRWNGWQS